MFVSPFPYISEISTNVDDASNYNLVCVAAVNLNKVFGEKGVIWVTENGQER